MRTILFVFICKLEDGMFLITMYLVQTGPTSPSSRISPTDLDGNSYAHKH
jgi:hypothetical protein